MPGSGRRLLYVKPSVDCADSATCGRCMDAPTGKLDLDPDQSYADVVILLHEDDFPCFQRHSEFSQVCCLFSMSRDAAHTPPWNVVIGPHLTPDVRRRLLSRRRPLL